MTIAALLDEATAQRPDRRMLIDVDGRTLTVGEVARLSFAATRWLADRGVEPGMTVAWQLPSHSAAAVVMLALARMPIVQAPVLHLFRQREVATALEVAGADVLIVDSSTADNAGGGSVITLPDDLLEILDRMSAEPALVEDRRPDAARWIYFTSGTTGRPKGVRHTDSSLLTAARGFTAYYGLGSRPDDVGTLGFPIAHIGGIIYVAATLIGGFPAVLIPKIDPKGLSHQLARHRVTISGSSTAFYQILLAAQLASGSPEPLIPSLRLLIGGGAPCPAELHHKVRRHLGVPVAHAYGMTEAPLICISEITDTEEQQTNTCGRPIPGARVRIGPTGEIEVSGANLTLGYVDPEQWAQATTADGWFRTGDAGHLRPDGRIVITGRVKDLIIRKGENISPEEIENELLAHPRIDQVAVVGLPDEERGELVCAVVRRKPGVPDVTLDDVCVFLDERGLMKLKWPERLAIVDEFPMTGLGKIAKRELAQQLTGGTR